MRPFTEEFIDICTRLYAKGYVAATDGNVSARLEDGTFLCTPSGKNKGDLRTQDLLTIDSRGNVIRGQGKPSTEIQMHLEYYRLRPDVKAVVHAHSPYCTGFATAGQGLTGCVLPEIAVSLGNVPLAPYATPSTHEVPSSIAPYIETHDVILLQNHGVVAAGTCLRCAYYALEKTEHAAQIVFIARMLGGETRLTEGQMNRLYNIAQTSYGIDAERVPKCEPAICNNTISASSKDSLEIKERIERAINDLGL